MVCSAVASVSEVISAISETQCGDGCELGGRRSSAQDGHSTGKARHVSQRMTDTGVVNGLEVRSTGGSRETPHQHNEGAVRMDKYAM